MIAHVNVQNFLYRKFNTTFYTTNKSLAAVASLPCGVLGFCILTAMDAAPGASACPNHSPLSAVTIQFLSLCGQFS